METRKRGVVAGGACRVAAPSEHADSRIRKANESDSSPRVRCPVIRAVGNSNEGACRDGCRRNRPYSRRDRPNTSGASFPDVRSRRPRAGRPHRVSALSTSSPLPWTSRYSPIKLVTVSVEAPLEFVTPREPKPEWLKVRAPGSDNYLRLKGIMQDLKLNTVCEDARCPNIGECWHHGTATFMILGDVCTRACAYCAVAHGRPTELDTAEPARVAEAVDRMGLQYAVITSVDRDDLADGGASIFAETIRVTRARVPGCRIEVLIPDFQGHRIVACGPCSTPGPTSSITTSRPCRGSIGWRDPAAATRDRWSCSIAPGAIGRRSRPRPASWWVSARSATKSSRCSTTCAASASRFSRSGSTSGHRPTHAQMTRYYHPDEFAELKRDRARQRVRARGIRSAGQVVVSRPRAGGRLRSPPRIDLHSSQDFWPDQTFSRKSVGSARTRV